MEPPKKLFDFEHDGERLDVLKGQYMDGYGIAIMIHTQDGLPFATLSVNLPEQNKMLGEDEFFVKNYSENESVANTLSKYFKHTTKTGRAGRCTVPVWRLNVKSK